MWKAGLLLIALSGASASTYFKETFDCEWSQLVLSRWHSLRLCRVDRGSF